MCYENSKRNPSSIYQINVIHTSAVDPATSIDPNLSVTDRPSAICPASAEPPLPTLSESKPRTRESFSDAPDMPAGFANLVPIPEPTSNVLSRFRNLRSLNRSPHRDLETLGGRTWAETTCDGNTTRFGSTPPMYQGTASEDVRAALSSFRRDQKKEEKL